MMTRDEKPVYSESRWQTVAELSLRGELGCEHEASERVAEILMSIHIPDRVLVEAKQAVAKVIEKEMYNMVADQARLTLKSEIPHGMPPVLGDVTCLRRVLDNLLSNAIKFTPSGGVVTIQMYHSGASLVLKVKDTGIGIPAEEQKRIFDRFYQVDRKRRHRGMGLGLALVKELVESLGGQISVESESGQGSTFTVTMPVHTQ